MRYTGFKSHDTKTSSGTSDEQTFTPPAGAHGFYVTVATNGCWMTFDGTTGTISNGLAIPKDSAPVFFRFAKPVTVVSQASANSVVNVAWVSG